MNGKKAKKMSKTITTGVAGDFSAIDHIGPILMNLSKVWKKKKNGDVLNAPHLLLKCILENQGMKLIPEYNAHGKCVGYRVWYEQDCNRESQKYSAFPDSIGCDIPTGGESEISHCDYTENCVITAGRSLKDGDCASPMYGINRSASKIQVIIESLREGLAASMSNHLFANAQPNNWQGTYGNIVGNQTEFTGAQFNDLKLMYHLDMIAKKNCLKDYKIVNGDNFWECFMKAIDGKCCGDASDRTRLTRYPMFFDANLDEYLNRNSTFLFDPSCIGFHNRVKYENSAPVKLHTTADGGELYGFSVPDPECKWLSIDENGNERLIPIRYDIEYKKKCIGRENGEIRYSHDFFGTFTGAQHMAPIACGDKCASILEIVNIG